MMLALWQGPVSSWGLADILVLAVIICACVAIAIAAIKFFEIRIPPVVVYIFWIVVVACVAIFAIRLIASM